MSQRGKKAAGARRPAPSRAVPFVQAVGVAGALALGARMLHVSRHYYHDDAYITLRYARNLLSGIGPVWNPGERVQGYTNFLHMVLVSAFGLAGTDLVWASRAVGVLSLLALVAGLLPLGRLLATDERSRAYGHVPAIFAAASAPLIVWSIGGLEGSLFALLTSVGCLLFAAALTRPSNTRLFAAAGVSLALGVLARPDGSVFVAVTALWLLATWRSRPLRSAAAFAVPCFGIILAQACWQLAYYGDAVPNTFYAKAGGFSPRRWAMGVAYLRTYVLEAPFLPLLAPAAALASTMRGWRGDRRVTYLALLVVAYGFFVAFIGGDYMPAFRLLLPVIVPLAAIFSLVLPPLLGAPRALAVAAVTALALALSALQVENPVVNPENPDPAAVVGTAVGKYIAWAWPSGSLVALNTAGSTPYYAPGLRFIDMLGLNDARIARRRVTKIEVPWQTIPGHLKGDGAYVLSRAPDFIILGPAEGAPADEPRATNTLAPWFLSDLEISRDPRFWDRYELEQVRVGRNGETVSERGLVFSYYRKKAP